MTLDPRAEPAARVPFWQRPRIRRMVPLAIGVAALVMLLLTLLIAPHHGRQFVPPAAPPRAPEKAFVTEAHATFREGASASARPIAVIDRGTPVTVSDQQGIWCKATDAAGKEGFLLRQSIELESERAGRVRRGETILKFTPLSGEVINPTWMLLGAYSFAPVYAQAAQGAALDIYCVDHGYYAVKLPDDTLGFLSAADVDLVPSNPSEPGLKKPTGKVVTGISIVEGNPETGEAPPAVPSASPIPAPGVPIGAAPPLPPAGASSGPGELTPAILVEKVEPVYPGAARAAHAAGTVVLEISIDVQGAVTKVDVKREAPLGMTQAAIDAVSRWRFQPARTSSGPIASMKLVRIDFRLPG